MRPTPLERTRENTDPEMHLLGPWRAKVLSNRDPQEKRGRLTVEIRELADEGEIVDVEPMYPAHSQDIPEVGQYTWVTFRHLDRNLPMWHGAWWPDDRKPPAIDGNPKRRVYQIVDADNQPKFTFIEDRDANLTTIRLDDAGCIIEFDGNTKQINLFSDKGKGDTAPITLNGPGLLGAARKFDKVTTICPFTGMPMDGLIVKGSKRVLLSNDQSPI